MQIAFTVTLEQKYIKSIKSHIAQPFCEFLFSDVYIQEAENVQTDGIKLHGYNCQ